MHDGEEWRQADVDRKKRGCQSVLVHPFCSPLLMKPTTAFAAVFLALSSLAASAATFTVEKTPSGGAIVKVDGHLFTEYVVDQANKPYLWPIYGPTGTSMTRAYPMEKVEGEQHDHPHHRGLCFGHENIGGYDTWAERSTFGENPKGKGEERVKHLGELVLVAASFFG